MPSFIRLFVAAALVGVAYSSALPASLSRIASAARCSDARVILESTISVDSHSIAMTQISCGAGPSHASREVDPVCPKNVCGVQCSNSCNTFAGNLPPITDDCDKIKKSIAIFSGNSSPYFTASSKQLTALTYGTCRYFFANTGIPDLQYCWSGLSSTASSAGSLCFPPTQPLNSEGLCKSADGTWFVSVSHS